MKQILKDILPALVVLVVLAAVFYIFGGLKVLEAYLLVLVFYGSAVALMTRAGWLPNPWKK